MFVLYCLLWVVVCCGLLLMFVCDVLLPFVDTCCYMMCVCSSLFVVV